MKVLLTALPVAFAAVSSSQPQLFDSSHMLETFKAIAAQKIAQGGEISRDTKENIERILNLIEANLTMALKKDYDLVTRQYAEEVAELENCNTEVAACKAEGNAQELAEYLNAQQTHENCRAFEHEVCTYSNGDCTDVNNMVTGFAAPVWGQHTCDDACSEGSGGPVSQFMASAKRFAEQFGAGCGPGDADACYYNDAAGVDGRGCSAADRVANTMQRASALGGGERLNGTRHQCCDYASCRSNCQYSQGLLVEQKKQCNNVQATAEREHCGFLGTGCACCDDYFQCWDRKSTELNTYRESAKQTIDLIHVQQEALECLVCYGEQILEAGTDDFSHCEREGCRGCSAYPYPCGSNEPSYGSTGECTADMQGNNGALDLSYDLTALHQGCGTEAPAAFTGECTQCAVFPPARAGSVTYECAAPGDAPTRPPPSDDGDKDAEPEGEGENRPEPEGENEPEPEVAEPEAEKEAEPEAENEPEAETKEE